MITLNALHSSSMFHHGCFLSDALVVWYVLSCAEYLCEAPAATSQPLMRMHHTGTERLRLTTEGVGSWNASPDVELASILMLGACQLRRQTYCLQ